MDSLCPAACADAQAETSPEKAETTGEVEKIDPSETLLAAMQLWKQQTEESRTTDQTHPSFQWRLPN